MCSSDLIEADMRTPGVVVLADTWDPGWRATLDGQPVAVLRANHMLRGIEVPEGRHVVEMIYWPASLQRGLFGAAIGIAILMVWGSTLGVVRLRSSRRATPGLMDVTDRSTESR